MSSVLENLTASILHFNKITDLAQTFPRSVQRIQKTTESAFEDINTGAASLGDTGKMLLSFVNPAQEFEKALSKLELLGVPSNKLDKLAYASRRFAGQFGGDAIEVVKSGAFIHEGLKNLTAGELAAITTSNAILDKATGIGLESGAEYITGMNRIFEKDAAQIGKAAWSERLVGKTTQAADIFNADAVKIANTMRQLGAEASLKGIGLDEQLSIVASLQGSLGPQAEGAYQQLLQKLPKMSLGGNDQKIAFTDGNNQLLPMVSILEKLQKLTGTTDLNPIKQLLVQQLGEEGASGLIALSKQSDRLKSSLAKLGKIKGIAPALKKALFMSDQLGIFKGNLQGMKVLLGGTLLPVINTAFAAVNLFLRGINWLLEKIPPLRWLIGGLVLAVTILSSALSGLLIISGLLKLLRAFIFELRVIWAWCLLNSAATHKMTLAQRINAVTQMLWNRTLGRSVIMVKLATGIQWLWNASLKSSIFWQKLGVIYSTLLALITGKLTMQSVLAILAINGLTLASMRKVIVDKLLVFWSGICKTATIALNLAMFALKLTLLAGVIPAVLATGAGLLALKIPMLIISAISWIMSGGLAAAAVSAWAFAAALWATGIPEIVLLITALVAAVAAVYYWFDEINAVLPGLADYLLIALGPLGWIAEMIKNWGNLGSIFTRLGAGLKVIYDWIAGKLMAAFQALNEFWAKFEKICPNIAGLLKKLFIIFWAGVTAPYRMIGQLANAIYQGINQVLGQIAGFFAGIWSSITGTITAVWSFIKQTYDDLIGYLGEKLFNLFSWISNLGAVIGEAISGIFSSIDGWIGSVLRKIAQIPGMGFLDPDITVSSSGNPQSVIPDVTAARQSADVPAGGVRNSQTNNNFGGVQIYAPGGISPAQLEEWAMLQG